MKYFLDTEFNGYRGELISLALIRDDGAELYLANKTRSEIPDKWVALNVDPIIDAIQPIWIERESFGNVIAGFLKHDPLPHIISDWPDDIRYFCECLITAPGEIVNIPTVRFDVERVDAYPTELVGAVQHNALWDARALKAKLTERGALPPLIGAESIRARL